MYDELVKRLNAYSAEHECHGGITAEAADAIEKLSQRVEDLEAMREISPETEYAIDKHADNLISHMEELTSGLKDKPHWIPVAERLPEKRKWVLCRCEADIIEVLRWENNEWYHVPMHVYYPSFVTHWMPLPSTDGLPQPPKEEA